MLKSTLSLETFSTTSSDVASSYNIVITIAGHEDRKYEVQRIYYFQQSSCPNILGSFICCSNSITRYIKGFLLVWPSITEELCLSNGFYISFLFEILLIIRGCLITQSILLLLYYLSALLLLFIRSL